MNAPSSPGKSFKRFSMHMSNGTLKLCDSWNLLGKLVSRGVVQAPCGYTLVSVPKARTQFLVVASMGLQKPHSTWPPIQALACLVISFDDVTSSYLSRFSGTSDSSLN